jgi:hypothetical protein
MAFWTGVVLLSGCSSPQPPPPAVQVESPKPAPQEQKSDIGAW